MELWAKYVTGVQGKKKERGGREESKRRWRWASETRGGVWSQKGQEPQVRVDDDGGGKAGNKEVCVQAERAGLFLV